MISQAEAIEKSRLIAKQIASEEIDAFDGAMRIWKEVLNHLDGRIPDALWPFKSNASAIEDYVFNAQDSGANHDAQIMQCKARIVEAAKSLLLNTHISST